MYNTRVSHTKSWESTKNAKNLLFHKLFDIEILCWYAVYLHFEHSQKVSVQYFYSIWCISILVDSATLLNRHSRQAYMWIGSKRRRRLGKATTTHNKIQSKFSCVDFLSNDDIKDFGALCIWEISSY